MVTWNLCRIGKQYHFSASHLLTGVPDSHPCSRLHGHNYVVEVEVRGETQPRTGFVMDFYDLDDSVKPLIDQLDHTHLNDTIDNPTAENIAQWILERIHQNVAYSVKVWETPKCWAMAINADGLFKGAHKE
jgi:6-pyruvoyltetrahydropterin/6-carboxytetrahydropterin synthase